MSPADLNLYLARVWEKNLTPRGKNDAARGYGCIAKICIPIAGAKLIIKCSQPLRLSLATYLVSTAFRIK